MKRWLFSFSMILFTVVTTYSQSTKEPFLPLKIDEPPKIDGLLDEAVWQNAPYETGFVSYSPDYGKKMEENTKVWYAYDRENLYFAFRCYDSEPDKIKASVSSRDKIRADDWICLNLDTFNDHQSLYALYVNPLGIQMDSRATAVSEDYSIDVVWYSNGKIDDEGYTLEIQIPFKSIRFSHKNPVEMGIIFERFISRKTTAGTYPALDPKQGPNFLTQTRPLLYYDVKHYQLLEILPAVTYGRNSSIEEGKLVSEGDKSDVSLTAKYGITSHLILDGTINPDFSQVEADAGQVDFNQRFALYYPEKRPFFLEGREKFDFGGSNEGDPFGAVVYTRNIVNPIVGVKLNGRVSDKNTIASIYARDELQDYQAEGEYADFAILRYKRSLSKDSFLGGYFTAREVENGYNRVLGSDAQIRINDASNIGFHTFLSMNKENNQRESSNGHAVGIRYFYNTRNYYSVVRLHDLSDDFTTKTGYVTRLGVTRFRGGIIRMLYPKSDFFKRFDALTNLQFFYDKASKSYETSVSGYLTAVMPRSSSIRAGYNSMTEIFLSEKFKVSNFSLFARSQFTKQFYINLNYKYGNKIRYVSNPYQGKGSSASASVIYQPSSKIHSSLSYTYSDFYREIDDQKEFDYSIIRFRNTYQVNKYLFFRAIVEHNSFYDELTTDFLVSFTYIPGTVIHLGYGSLYDKIEWRNNTYVESDRFLETKRGFFFKTSYLWRM